MNSDLIMQPYKLLWHKLREQILYFFTRPYTLQLVKVVVHMYRSPTDCRLKRPHFMDVKFDILNPIALSVGVTIGVVTVDPY